MTRSWLALLALAPPVLYGQEITHTASPDYSELKYAKPDTLPLTIDVTQSCDIATDEFRGWVEREIERAAIHPVNWPTLQGDKPWFGLYVGLTCVEKEPARLNVAFIDAIDGKLELFGGLNDNPAGREWSDSQHMTHVGLTSPEAFPMPYGMQYASFVERIVSKVMPLFLEKRFAL